MEQSKVETITKLFNGKETRIVWNSDKEYYCFRALLLLVKSNISKNY